MATSDFGAMLQAGSRAGKDGFHLISDVFSIASTASEGAKNFVQDLTAPPSEKEKQMQEANQQRDFLLMQGREMERQQRELERLGCKSFAELKQKLEDFYGTNQSDNQ